MLTFTDLVTDLSVLYTGAVLIHYMCLVRFAKLYHQYKLNATVKEIYMVILETGIDSFNSALKITVLLVQCAVM
jgi:hypothetical protein